MRSRVIENRDGVVKSSKDQRWRGGARALAGVILFFAVAGQQPICAAEPLVAVDAFGLRIPRGFRISLFATAEQANDIRAMTISPRGEVVVTGPGYIRSLLDPNGHGRAEVTQEFATTTTGGQGLCFAGNELYFIGDGGLWRFQDSNADGVSDGVPEKLASFDVGEYGAHAIRQGPDGALYLIGGSEAQFTNQQVSLPEAPMKSIEGGALLRVLPNGRLEALAHGFQNPYGFDFNLAGEIFSADSETPADLFLPWYTQARLYHVGLGGHHGWRLPGHQPNANRADYYADTVNVMGRTGPGSPAGVASYRHYQFPPYYQNGLFVCDWTLGKVYFARPQPAGASYQANWEVFLDTIGMNGFAPTALAVTLDGSLLVSTGGRKTPGAVYRIDFPASRVAVPTSNWWVTAESPVEAVLAAPQPYDAWSRALWMPTAAQLGRAPFEEVVPDQRLAPPVRIRAVEILTELFGGLSPDIAAAGADANVPVIRARVAWSLGRIPCDNFAPLILKLTRDTDPFVRRCALEAVVARANLLDVVGLQQAIGANLAHPDKRVRLCAARVATLLPEAAWRALWAQVQGGAPQARLTAALAMLWRSSPDALNTPVMEACAATLAQTRIPDLRMQAIRLLMLALGDYKLTGSSGEASASFEPALPLNARDPLSTRICAALRAGFPSGYPSVDLEATRLLAMLEDDAPELPGKILAQITEATPPGVDLHFLLVLSRLAAPLPTNASAQVARAIVSLDRKLAGQQVHPLLNWNIRLVETVRSLLRRDPSLAEALVREPGFASPAHVDLVPLLVGEQYDKAARVFQAAVVRNPNFEWSEALIEILAALPDEQVQPLFRQQWTKPALRDALTSKLAAKPEAIDRDKFLAGLLSQKPEVVRASCPALLKLPSDKSEKGLLPALISLRKLCQQPAEAATRAELIKYLNREVNQSFKVEEPPAADPNQLKRAYSPVFGWFALKYPELSKRLEAETSEDPSGIDPILHQVVWSRGNAGRGESLFQDRGCASCHGGVSPIGPDLGGITSRLSLTNLFHAIVYPSREVAAPYRMTTFQTRTGQTISGLVVHETMEVVLVQTSQTTTTRLHDAEILSRQVTNLSFMPNNLLKGMKSLDHADLYSYLKDLPPTTR